ncbi:DUF4267 domain-containing protein [Umezawaea sp.]|uniref:DUF4267 domain-containing protein n=1 Tax=Umezawaea sp. TaxID=1955258 RepID=UPI002ED00F20
MLTNIAYVLAGLIGAGIIVIGARALWSPRAAVGFGIPNTPVEDRNFQSWLSVKAVRDIASGLFTFILMAGGTPELLGWFILAAAGIPVGDALIVLRGKGPKSAAYGIHGVTAAVMLVTSVLLLAT